MWRFALRDLTRNPRRTLAAMVGVILGVGLFSSVLFFVDASGATMTTRALAPVDIDMQRILTSPLGQSIGVSTHLGATRMNTGQVAQMTLVVSNPAATPAHAVVLKDRLPSILSYVPGSTRSASGRIQDPGAESPFSSGPGHVGRNIGTLKPGQSVRFTYRVRATRPIAATGSLPPSATVSSREYPLPIRANRAAAQGLDRLAAQIRTIPGVASADVLSFAELSPGSLRGAHGVLDRSLKVFGFDRGYVDHFPKIRLSSGSLRADGALLSPSAARTLGVHIGDSVQLQLPGGAGPVDVPVTGIVDLSHSRALFNSREGNKLEQFLYVPDSIVVTPKFFADRLIPAFRQAAAATGQALALKSPPTLEVDLRLAHGPLSTDPGSALNQTQRIAGQVRGVAAGQDFVLDNASNALKVARDDAAVAKRMFLFLGLPGLVLAGVLAGYAGAVLAATQRREHALLRLRGADHGQLRRILLHRTVMLAGIGSIVGCLVGLVACAAVLGWSSIGSTSVSTLAISTLLSLGAGLVATGAALYLPSHRAMGREVTGESRALAVDRDARWRRFHLDLVVLGMTLAAAVAAERLGYFDAPKGNVTQGVHTILRSELLLLPISGWLAGIALGGRLCEVSARRTPFAAPPRFGGVVRGLLARSVSRRSRGLFLGVVGVGLVVAIGTGLAVFATSYQQAKAADARFTVGSDLRITPSPLSTRAHPASYASSLLVPGVSSTTPVVAGLENSTLRSTFNSDAYALAAIDPVGYARTVAPPDEVFVGTTARAALQALAGKANNVLLDEESASFLKLHVGDTAQLLMARGTPAQQLRPAHVVGLFSHLPAFPEGVNVVMNLDYYQSQTHLTNADFYLAATQASGQSAAAAAGAITAGPGSHDRLSVETVDTSVNRDESSLTALNTAGLLRLDSFFTLAMSVAVIAIFVFGMILHRRKEYVVLSAQGLPSSGIFALLLGETALVSFGGLVSGLVVGAGLGVVFVRVLTPLFILTPGVVFSFSDVWLLVGLVLGAMLLAAGSAYFVIRSLPPSEVLREQ